jgi:uncharacterized protein (TIGR02453 family)
MPQAKPIFTRETFRFFQELARHNKKEWMDANRERYQQHVVAPFRALLEALAPAALKLNAHFDVSGRTGVNFSRINRDIRFSKDKSPYRLQMYLFFSDRRAQDGDAQLYVGLSADAVTAGVRIYGGERDSRLVRLAAPRAQENLKWLSAQARKLGRKYDSYWYSSEKGDWRQRGGFPLAAGDWKRIRGWVVRKKMQPAAALRAGFAKDAAKILAEVFPLYKFLSADRWP